MYVSLNLTSAFSNKVICLCFLFVFLKCSMFLHILCLKEKVVLIFFFTELYLFGWKCDTCSTLPFDITELDFGRTIRNRIVWHLKIINNQETLQKYYGLKAVEKKWSLPISIALCAARQLHHHLPVQKTEKTTYLQVPWDIGTCKNSSGCWEKNGKDREETFSFCEAWPKVFCKYWSYNTYNEKIIIRHSSQTRR